MGSKANGPMARPLPYGLLMRYVAQVQRTGRCHYPPLETHLRQWAQERRLREEQAIQEEIEEGAQAVQPEQPGPEPTARQPVAAEPVTAEPVPPQPMPPEPLQRTPVAAIAEPAPALEPATPPGTPLLAPATGAAPTPAPVATAPPAGPSAPAHQAPATAAAVPVAGTPSMPATTHTSAGAANPQLTELLRFREEVRRSGRCDHPELMERVAANLAARQLDGGNSREALERLRLRGQAQMARIRSDLAAQANPSHGSCMAIGHRLGQLRALLDDGFHSYASQLDPPLRRMVRRQLRRAAELERTLIRRQRLAPAQTAAWGQLELLASCLEGVLDQWLPSTAGPLRLAPRPDPANAIRPAAVHQRREGAERLEGLP